MELSSSDSVNMEEEEEEEDDEDAAGKESRRPVTRRSILTSPIANGANVDYDELGRSCRSSLPGLKKTPSIDSSDSSRGSQNGQAWDPSGGSPRKSRKVHLTQFELEGLRCLVDELESLPLHKKCVPTGIEDEDALIADVKVGLSECKALPVGKLGFTLTLPLSWGRIGVLLFLCVRLMLHLRGSPGIWGWESRRVAGPWLGVSWLSVQECSLLMQFTSSFGCGLCDSWSLFLAPGGFGFVPLSCLPRV